MISEADRSTFSFVCTLVIEECEDGQRTLFYHPERELVENNKEKRNKLDQSVTDPICNFNQNK